MILKKIFFALTICAAFTACNTESTPATTSDEASTEQSSSANDGKHFGETITADGAVSYADLLTKMTESDSIPIKLIGTVSDVCQKKGCWMNIVNEESKDSEPLFVQFKDYGFFMPFDIAGRKVVMDGYAYREVTSVEDLKHYAEDAKEPQEVIDAITEPKTELKFLASGVLLLDPTETH